MSYYEAAILDELKAIKEILQSRIPIPMTNAERQRRYRARKVGVTDSVTDDHEMTTQVTENTQDVTAAVTLPPPPSVLPPPPSRALPPPPSLSPPSSTNSREDNFFPSDSAMKFVLELAVETSQPKDGRATHIFSYWVTKRSKRKDTKLSKERSNKIKKRLAEGFTVEQLLSAIDGVANDPWDGRVCHDDITQIFRDAASVERFMTMADKPPRRVGSTLQIDTAAHEEPGRKFL